MVLAGFDRVWREQVGKPKPQPWPDDSTSPRLDQSAAPDPSLDAARPRRSRDRNNVQRDPEVAFLAKCFFGGLGCQGQETTCFPEMSGFLALPPRGGKATKPFVSGHRAVFRLGTPGLPKTTWPKDHLGIPLKVGKPKPQPWPDESTSPQLPHFHYHQEAQVFAISLRVATSVPSLKPDMS